MKTDFDVAAKSYDTIFTNSKVGIAQRKMVYKHLNTLLKSERKSILEVNCGTGEDAIFFSKNNHDVIATDISEEMITVAREKSNNTSVEFKVQDITTISASNFNKTFDLIFSNFGGLNCLSKDDLHSFLKTCDNLLKTNGKLALVIMPKNCLWERMYFYLKGNRKKANRRHTTKPVLANVNGIKVKTWYYNPEQLRELEKDKFTTKLVKPIGLAIPPSYLENSVLTSFPFFSILKMLDKIFNFSYLSKYADHYLIILEKK